MDGFTFQPSPRRTGTTRNVPTLQRQKSILKNPSPPTSYSSPSSLRQVIAEGIAQAGQPQSVKNMAARRAYLWGLVAQGGPPKDLDALVREIKHLDTEIKAARPPRPEWRSCRCCRPNTAAIWETEDGQAVSREDNSWDTSSNELSDEEDLDEPEYMCVRSRSKSLDMEALTMVSAFAVIIFIERR